ncbi:MAG: hypothetical protein ACJAS1_005113 [Oleiphilaceae bacterium]|jgi:hypothetical protein
MEPLGQLQKEIPVSKFIKKIISHSSIVFLALSGLISVSVNAQEETSICRETGVALVLFNGVNTTPSGANRAKEELKRIHGEQSENGDNIRYEVLYNYSDGFADFVETFEQRLLEQEGLLEGRFELFFEAIRGSGTWWSSITETVSSAADILDGFSNWYQAAAIQQLTRLLATPPTEVNYVEHRTRIDNWVLEGYKLLFVAHSQGNLFANAAYNYAITKTSEDSVKVVHVAPASPILNGSHTLADLDLVINGLRLVGSVPSITDNIPGYLLRSAGVNGEKDILGHGFLEIYLNPSLSTAARVKEHINSALVSLIAPPVEASAGFFTATLTWNGSGDVDLHAFEPEGSHVYYSDPSGVSGYLDVDNTVANGPEHYYATCDSSQLQTGVYQISIANYNAADGKTATVQIASWNDGVLGTKSVVLGSSTGDDPVYSLFSVEVTKNDDTNKYSISISQ